ncbi:hypothetical protein HanPSC8_Chr16g0732581 [Helianthus annuus]|nr:hypothetical protein HanPSC8_Chr16g0732581 [Helianthus annuus]
MLWRFAQIHQVAGNLSLFSCESRRKLKSRQHKIKSNDVSKDAKTCSKCLTKSIANASFSTTINIHRQI